MNSPRLEYRPISFDQHDDFHSLVRDPHVRQYLLDGIEFPPDWSAERIADSDDLFRRRGVGLWLARQRLDGALVGFCGFLEMPAVYPGPQLVYALFQPFTGQGMASEMARAAIAEARRHPGFDDIAASVDQVNVRSVRLLERLGFARATSQAGAFGPMWIYLLRPGAPPAAPSRPGA